MNIEESPLLQFFKKIDWIQPGTHVWIVDGNKGHHHGAKLLGEPFLIPNVEWLMEDKDRQVMLRLLANDPAKALTYDPKEFEEREGGAAVACVIHVQWIECGRRDMVECCRIHSQMFGSSDTNEGSSRKERRQRKKQHVTDFAAATTMNTTTVESKTQPVKRKINNMSTSPSKVASTINKKSKSKKSANKSKNDSSTMMPRNTEKEYNILNDTQAQLNGAGSEFDFSDVDSWDNDQSNIQQPRLQLQRHRTKTFNRMDQQAYSYLHPYPVISQLSSGAVPTFSAAIPMHHHYMHNFPSIQNNGGTTRRSVQQIILDRLNQEHARVEALGSNKKRPRKQQRKSTPSSSASSSVNADFQLVGHPGAGASGPITVEYSNNTPTSGEKRKQEEQIMKKEEPSHVIRRKELVQDKNLCAYYTRKKRAMADLENYHKNPQLRTSARVAALKNKSMNNNHNPEELSDLDYGDSDFSNDVYSSD